MANEVGRCPKCDAVAIGPATYGCRSFYPEIGVNYQSDVCRIRELERENARLRDKLNHLITAGKIAMVPAAMHMELEP